MGKKRGKAARNARKNLLAGEPEELTKAPHSFVINRGKLGKNVNDLMMNFRKIMEPFTASQLKVRRQNVVKDFVHIAGALHVTHLVIFTKTKEYMYFRVGKLPRGPTLTFQIKEYSLIRDVISSQKKSLMYERLFEHQPLLVLNNFSGEGMHFKLMTSMFQSMFPSINVNKTNVNAIRRCLLFHYNDDKTIDMRQYAIKVVPAGISKAVKKLIQSKVPNLSRYETVDEFMQKSGNLSDSEVEADTAANTVTLPQPISSRGNIMAEKSAIRLFEIGPRMKLQLIKIEEGLMSGEVLFHEFVKRTPEEVAALKERLKAKKLLKQRRRAEQNRNVEKKKKAAQATEEKKEDESEDETKEDIEWYKKEVGEEPDEGMLGTLSKRKREPELERPAKKRASRTEHKEKAAEKKLTLQDYLKRRKQRKEAKLIKKKKKQQSQKIMSMRARMSVNQKGKRKK